MDKHQPVMLKEALEALRIKPEGRYFDGTFGRGGHSRAILERLTGQGSLFALDKDPAAVAAGQTLAADDDRLTVEQGSFADLELKAGEWRCGGFDGILLDLGVSSPQLDQPQRGFSFRADGPLDMRMDPTRGVTAADWLAAAPEQEMSRVFREFGEERKARRIARAIVESRRQKPLRTTGQLAGLIKSVAGHVKDKKHPATRCFQAIRIHINNELADLATGLQAAIHQLRPEGRLVVISFHSLEDRLVKRSLRRASQAGPVSRRLPAADDAAAVLRIIGKAQRPSEHEIDINPRARSAVLRVAERLT